MKTELVNTLSQNAFNIKDFELTLLKLNLSLLQQCVYEDGNPNAFPSSIFTKEKPTAGIVVNSNDNLPTGLSYTYEPNVGYTFGF